MAAVDDTPIKRSFDNRYATGQHTIDGILRETTSSSRGMLGPDLLVAFQDHGDRLDPALPLKAEHPHHVEERLLCRGSPEISEVGEEMRPLFEPLKGVQQGPYGAV